MSEFYRQCQLERAREYLTAWIPERFAKRNRYLRIDADELGNGWRVHRVGMVRLPLEEMRDRSQDYKRTRKASDV